MSHRRSFFSALVTALTGLSLLSCEAATEEAKTTTECPTGAVLLANGQCACPAGTTANADATACYDTDECKDGTAVCDTNATCVNGDEGYTCSCNSGYTGDGKTCSKGGGCPDGQAPGAKGACENIDECATGNPCGDHGTCSDLPLLFACACDAGYVLDSVTGKCVVGACPDGQAPGATGACENIDECATGNPCGDHGTCADLPLFFSCACDAGYVVDSVTGQCVSNGCDPGYELDPDPTNPGECIDINECSDNVDECDEHANCSNKPGTYECTCYSDYAGDGKTCTLQCDAGEELDVASGKCVDIDECTKLTDNCGTHGDCGNTNGGFTCQCDSGYFYDPDSGCVDGACGVGFTTNTLGQCTDINECVEGTDDCSDDANCVNQTGTFACFCDPTFVGDGKTCECPAGYELSGSSCVDIDECAKNLDDCDANATCIDWDGTFKCVCKTGFTGNGKSCGCYPGYEIASGACADVDECAGGADDCHDDATCTDSTGSYSCKCNVGFVGTGKTCTAKICSTGYELDTSGNCVDVNECVTLTAGCSEDAACTNKAGGFSCKCYPGYQGDGKTCVETTCSEGYAESTPGNCVDVDECANATNDCAAVGSTCTNKTGSFSCSCLSGFAGDGKVCNCPAGSAVSATGTTCADLDECASGEFSCDANAACVNKASGYSCKCNTGYLGDGKSCAAKTCNPGYALDANNNCADINECTSDADDCDSDATCTNTTGSFSCKCKAGFVGDGVICAVKTCNSGYALDGNGNCLDVNECTAGSAGCDTNATCSNTQGGFACKCKATYTGSGFTCIKTACQDGYAENTAGSCVDVDECKDGTADCAVTGGKCTNTAGAFTCSCASGFTGDGKLCGCANGSAVPAGGTTCADINECTAGTHDCDGNAACTNKSPNFTCKCNTGYDGDGKTCSVKTCNAGYLLNAAGTCADVDECLAGTDDCAELGGKCSNNTGAFSCSCVQPFTGNGKTCSCATGSEVPAGGTTCVDLDECALGIDTCDPNASCTNKINGFTCKCNAGFDTTGLTCTLKSCIAGYELVNGTCVDINECTKGTSGCAAAAAGGKCSNKPGGVTCTCLPGWEGNGLTCTDIDECTKNTDGCIQICTNIPAGSFTCSCEEGFTSQVKSCFDINECLDPTTYPCNLECFNSNGDWQCVSSIANESSEFVKKSCASIPFFGPYFIDHKTDYDADCRCTHFTVPPCDRPFDAALDALPGAWGTGPQVVDHANSHINGCATDEETAEVYWGVEWGNFNDNAQGYVMAMDAATGNRRIVSGRYLDPANGPIEVGTGPQFDKILDIALGTDGFLYVEEQSNPFSGSVNEDPPLQGITVFKVDLKNGNRTLVWNEREDMTQFGHCSNGDATNNPPTHIQVDIHRFALDPQNNFYFTILQNENPVPGNGVIKVSNDGLTCTWITRGGAKPGNLFSGKDIGTGAEIGAAKFTAIGYRNGSIYLLDWLVNRFIKVDIATGNRTVIANNSQPKLGTGGGMGMYRMFWYDYLGTWVLTGNDPNTPSLATLVDETNGDRQRWTRNLGDAYPMSAKYPLTDWIDGPALGDETTLLERPWCVSPLNPAELFVATDAVAITRLEVKTGNSINWSL